MSKTIETWYEIFEISADGLLKIPRESSYGISSNLFGSCKTIEEAEQSIIEVGESYTSYVVLAMKRKSQTT